MREVKLNDAGCGERGENFEKAANRGFDLEKLLMSPPESHGERNGDDDERKPCGVDAFVSVGEEEMNVGEAEQGLAEEGDFPGAE